MRGEVGGGSESEVLDDDQFGSRYGALHFASTLTRGHELFTSAQELAQDPFHTPISYLPREISGGSFSAPGHPCWLQTLTD